MLYRETQKQIKKKKYIEYRESVKQFFIKKKKYRTKLECR